MESDLPGISRISAIGRYLANVPYVLFGLGLLLLVLLHTGLRWPWTPDAEFLAVAQNWPAGSGWDSSIGWIGPARLGITGGSSWALLWISLIAASLTITFICARRTMGDPYARIFLLAVAASSIPFRLTGWIGFYDGLFLSGALLAVVLKGRLWWGGAIMIATANPEMGVIAGLSALLTGVGLQSSLVVRRGTGVLGMSALLLVFVSVTRLAANTPASESRLALLHRNLDESFTLNIGWWPLTIATMFAGGWIIVFTMIMTPALAMRRWLVLIGLVVFPLIFTLFTLDGSRVAVVSSSLAFVLAVREWLHRVRTSSVAQNPPAVLFPLMVLLSILALLTPAVSVLPYSPTADFYPPWDVLAQLREALAL